MLIFIYIYIDKFIYSYIHIYVRVFVKVYVYVNVCIYIYICVYICMYIYIIKSQIDVHVAVADIYMYIYIYVYLYTCICIYTYTYTYIYIYVCIHVHIHIARAVLFSTRPMTIPRPSWCSTTLPPANLAGNGLSPLCAWLCLCRCVGCENTHTKSCTIPSKMFSYPTHESRGEWTERVNCMTLPMQQVCRMWEYTYDTYRVCTHDVSCSRTYTIFSHPAH